MSTLPISKPDTLIGLKTIVKWFNNPSKRNAERHPVITRTLKKIGLVSSSADSSSNTPNDREFWIVEIEDIVKSTFILKPLECLNGVPILTLIPGFYTHFTVNNSVVVCPRLPGNWILPKSLKRTYGYVDSVVVVYNDKENNTNAEKELLAKYHSYNPYLVKEATKK